MSGQGYPVALREDEIHVFVASLATYRDLSDADLHQGILEPHELARAAHFHFERDRRRYLLTRTVARRVLARYLPLRPEALRFATNAYGRPAIGNRLDAAPVLQFNISHSSDVVALAVAHGRVGIDVEDVAAREVTLDIADRFFAPSEAHDIRRLPAGARKRRFFEYWTLKESYIKARGMGLSLDLGKVAFRLAPGAQASMEVETGLDPQSHRWRFWQFEAPPDSLFALCAEQLGDTAPQLRFATIVPCGSERAFRPLRISAPDDDRSWAASALPGDPACSR